MQRSLSTQASHYRVPGYVRLDILGPTRSLAGLVVSRDTKLDLGMVFQVQGITTKAPRHITFTRSPGFAGRCRAMGCGAAFALGQAGKDLQGRVAPVVVGQPCFEPWHGGDNRTYIP